MGSYIFALFFLMLHLSSATNCGTCVFQSNAARFPSSADLSAGACGYGPLALDFNGGYVAAASSTVYGGGVGCGACYNIRCKNEALCSSRGTKVIVTDLKESNTTEFVLSTQAFAAMARAKKTRQLMKQRIVGVEYKRIPCEYENRNMSIMVDKSSRPPSNLAIKFLYQGGQTDITVVDVFQEGIGNMQFMSRSQGAVWETDRAPAGPLQFRVLFTVGFDRNMAISERAVPADWKPGSIYDLGIQIHGVAWDRCSICGA